MNSLIISIILSAIFLTLFAIPVFGEGQTIKTLDGETYTNANITRLRPNGAEVHSDIGIATIPYAKLPKELQARYAYDAEELATHLKKGFEGIYTYREDQAALSGEVIEFKQGRFTYSTFTDTPTGFEDPRPLQGRYTVAGNWLILHHPKLPDYARIIVIIDGRLALIESHHYKDQKETGKPSNYSMPLYQRKPK